MSYKRRIQTEVQEMKQLRNYINIRKGKSIVKATDETVHQIVKDELDRFGHDTNLNHIDISEVTDTSRLFSSELNFSSFKTDLGPKYKDLNPDISGWDVSHVIKMTGMFQGCEKFNQDLSQWDVSNVKFMRLMFSQCESFNQDLSRWDVSNVENMYGMFYGCEKFNQDLSQWNVSNIKDARHIFNYCHIKEEFKPKFKV